MIGVAVQFDLILRETSGVLQGGLLWDAMKDGFMKGYVTKDDYANTLHAYQQRHNEMKSDNRDKTEEYFQQVN